MATVAERSLVDEIRAFVNSPDQTANERMMELAQWYARACQATNERLTRCAEFLERGLRTQAIEVAEAEPDLLRTVQNLNFPELDEWQEVAAEYGWARFQHLKFDVADMVHQSYEVEAQLSELLETHRYLALSGATIEKRLQVMRQIATIDATSPFWKEDIAEFERHRYEELSRIGQELQQTLDEQEMERFVKELEQEVWITQRPRHLHELYVDLAKTHYQTNGLCRIAGNLTSAAQNCDLNFDRLHDLREQWQRTLQHLHSLDPRWHPPRHLQEVANRVFQSLDQRDEQRKIEAYQRDAASLDRALDRAIQNETRIADLESLTANATAHGYQLPPLTLAKLDEYRQRLNEAKMLSTGVIIALGVVGVGAVVLLFFVLRGVITS